LKRLHWSDDQAHSSSRKAEPARRRVRVQQDRMRPRQGVSGRGSSKVPAAERKQEPKMSLASEMSALKTQRSREALGERAAERRSPKAGQT